MRRRAAALLAAVLLALAPSALAAEGLTYDDFSARYADNLTFINENASRHMLPLVFSASSKAETAEQYYRLEGDALTVVIAADSLTQVIQSCSIRITAPESMTYGGATYNDFAISGYHSYALLMAMDGRDTAYDRYALVTDVESGLAAAGEGEYACQVGAYELRCQRINQTVAMDFDLIVAEP